MLLISVLTTWIEVCSDYYVVEIDPINPCLRWEGVMSRQRQSWSYVLGLACCVGAFYCNHVLNICDLQCMHIFEHNIFFLQEKITKANRKLLAGRHSFSSSFSINWFSDFIIHVNSFYIFRTECVWKLNLECEEEIIFLLSVSSWVYETILISNFYF